MPHCKNTALQAKILLKYYQQNLLKILKYSSCRMATYGVVYMCVEYHIIGLLLMHWHVSSIQMLCLRGADFNYFVYCWLVSQ